MTAPTAPLLDCRWMSQPGGVGRVAQHLVRGLAELDAPGHPLTLWGSPEHIGEHPAWCHIAPTELVGHECKGQRQLLELPPHRGALYLHQVRPFRDWNSATLIHDTIQIRQGTPTKRRLTRAFLRQVAKRSRRILTVSEHSRRLIIDDLGGAPDKIDVLTLPIDRDLAARVRARRATLGTRTGTDVLWVGRVEPNKNVDGLMAAFAASGIDGRAPLRLFGATSAQRPGLLERGRALGIEHLDVARATTDDDLADAYARAALVVMPSFEEGWGLPAYEAIACGIPVIASSGGSLPELARFAHSTYQLVDVRTPGALAGALADAPLDIDHPTMDAHSLAATDTGPTRAALASRVLQTLTALASS
jgi:glycosyltransferase involved in cell wall biosynthesis